MASPTDIIRDKRQRLRLKSWAVFVTFFGAGYSLLTTSAGTIRPFLHSHFPKVFATVLATREQLFFAGTAALIGGSCAFYHARRFGRVFRFFGLSESMGLLFVLPTFTPESTHAYKLVMEAGQLVKKPKTLEAGPTYGHHNFDIIFRSLKRVSELQLADVFFATDEGVMPVGKREPDGEHVDGKSVVSFGSNSSNNLSTFLLDQYPFSDQTFFYRFSEAKKFDPTTRETGYALVRNGVTDAHPQLPEHLFTDGRYDYALLLRHTTDFSSYFLSAGLGPEGSESNIEYLFGHWLQIARWARGRDFYCIAKIDKLSKHGIPLVRAVRKRSGQEYEIVFISPELGNGGT